MTAPRSSVEFFALPEGPLFGMRRVEATDEDRSRGMILVEGQVMRIRPTCKAINIPIAPDLVAFCAEDDTPFSCTDADGQRWGLGRYANGEYFRQRMG